MTFDEILEQVITLLKRQGRVSYRALKMRFDLDDEYLDVLKEELLYVHPVIDDAGRGLVWTGETEGTPVSASQPDQTTQQPPAQPDHPTQVESPPPEPQTPEAEYFLYDRRLLSALSRCVWESLKVFFQETVSEEDAVPGAVIAIQTFGDFLGFNPHCHVLLTDGCFCGKATFRVSPTFQLKDLEQIFQHSIFKTLLSKGKITEDLVGMLMSWRHSGFNVFCGPRIYPRDEDAMENLARYIIRASFSQERMTYIAEKFRVVYQSKDGKEQRAFDPLEWLAAMCSHVPNKGEQTVRYYGYYSNVSNPS